MLGWSFTVSCSNLMFNGYQIFTMNCLGCLQCCYVAVCFFHFSSHQRLMSVLLPGNYRADEIYRWHANRDCVRNELQLLCLLNCRIKIYSNVFSSLPKTFFYWLLICENCMFWMLPSRLLLLDRYQRLLNLLN